MTFDEFVRRTPGMTPQLSWITDPLDDKILVDFVGKYENINTDVCRMVEHLGIKDPPPLPWLNTSDHDHYSAYYDKKLEMIVANRYKKEIQLFGYKFERPQKMM